MIDQENFWKTEYATEYLKKNNTFDKILGIECWKQMLSKTSGIESVLECGSNLGRNIEFLNEVLPSASKSIIEISPEAYDIVTKRFQLLGSFNGRILDSNFGGNSFDLVYTIGVLIHIHPDELLVNMEKMFSYSKRYIAMGEYFNRTPISIEYQGKMNALFKRDFGKFFIENFPVKLVDYGFLWGHLYDTAGFDDITYWVFEKR
jgi:pseudaminic acid biosynthesis-associated methylase